MKQDKTGYAFGTFKGVFTPSILTILGVVMYLRFGWVLGNLGLSLTLVVVTVSTSVTFLTALALSSLATNMKVSGGGAYYIISRSLGLETGAAVGLPLYLAQALGISFYIAGFSESICSLLPDASPQLIGIGTLIVLTGLAYLSADIAMKFQFFIMLAIILSLISFFFGNGPEAIATGSENLVHTSQSTLPFWTVFAVFFPAVTGIEAGISMSGDLKNPAKSLPLGTFAAILVGYVTYLAIPVFLASLDLPDEILLQNPLIMADAAYIGSLVLIGLWGASLSSALGALLGAPRTLQALAQDGIAPKIIAKGYGKNDDPRLATIISCAIALLGITLGDLNIIAPILSMFFLTSYCFLNLSAGFEELISGPSWRPTFKVSYKLNFLGALLCFLIMIMIDPGSAILALGVTSLVYVYLKNRRLRSHFGDARRGILFSLVKFSIDKLSETKAEARSWKPNILAMIGNPDSRKYLLSLAHNISQGGKSFVTLASVLPGKHLAAERIESTESLLSDFCTKHGFQAVTKVTRAHSIHEGMISLVEGYGFGPIVPNIIMLGARQSDAENIKDYTSLLALICELKRNLVIVRQGEGEDDLTSGSVIDIWWARKSNNAGLMLSLAFLLQKSQSWSKASIRLKTIVDSSEGQTVSSEESPLENFIKRERLDAEAIEVPKGDQSVFSVVKESSHDADLVMLGIRAPEVDEENYEDYYTHLMNESSGLPTTLFVYAGGKVSFKDLFRSV